MSYKCEPLNLGGRTVESPCEGWLCSPWDYFYARKMLQNERNALVTALTSYDARLWAMGKMKGGWTEATQAALDLANGASWDLLQEYGDSNWNLFRLPQEVSAPAKLFIDMATRCHAAACDVNAEIERLGGTPPSKPQPPQPTETIVDQVFRRAGEAAGGVAKFAAIGLALWGGAKLIESRSREKGDS
ncbi:hypothetical protein OV203_44890 [Nannocystis sp. ILAH1]|uniref:hypothetical protein n=1 Tax=Nannocystis sp. ILAH1 TaxID=2996789 RepID=UPI002271DDB0|nr:hypothetical protein [Nannocystis sp. ILAH1]MCY0994346.1 hypothetical protein [Nannocystis sp. ILAH1]